MCIKMLNFNNTHPIISSVRLKQFCISEIQTNSTCLLHIMESEETANRIPLGQVSAVQYSFPKEALDV